MLFTLFTEAQNIPRPNIPAPKGLAVNSFTGNLFYQRNEMSLRGTGLRVYLSFYYNAAIDTLDYGYGHGWSFYYNSFYQEKGDTVIIQHNDAKKDTFYLKSGAYKSPVDVYDTLIKNGNQYTLRNKNGRREVYADPAHKKITGIQDANGNNVIVEYSNQLPVKIRNSARRTLLLTWENNHLKESKDSSNPAKKFTYQYNDKNDLISVTNALNGTIMYDYSAHALTRLADENNNPVVIEYGGGGKVKSINSCNTEQRFAFADTVKKTFVTSKGGSGSVVNGYFFDAVGKLIGLSDANNNKMSFKYDSKNILTEWLDFKGRTTKYEYDSKGNLLKETDPLGNSMIYTYEPVFNQPATATDQKGNTTSFTYNSTGNITSVIKPGNITQTFTYDAAGRRLTATDGNNHTTSYQYNQNGDLVKIQYPVGAVVYEYNGSCCSVGKITDPNGNTLEMTYDLLNRTKSIKDAMGNMVIYDYDAVGNVIKETDPNGIPKEYTYDALNRLTSVKIKAGVWVYEYDGQSNLVKMTDAKGHSTIYEYNNKNEIIKETDAIGSSTRYSYDAGGSLVSRNDPNSNVVNYKYDEMDRLIEKSYDGNIDKYSYDGVGNLSAAYNNNIAYSFEYDNLNRLLKKNIITWNKIISYTYDGVDNRSTMKDHDGGLTQYVYDVNNRLMSLTNPSNLQTTFEYDEGGRKKRQNNANGTFTTYHYDAAGRIDSLINWKNNTAKISFFYYTFDQFGNRTSMQDKYGLNTYTYDSSYRLTKVGYADGSSEEFVIDGTGNRIQRIKNGVPTSYTYNSADQIQTAGASSFIFDANGNTIQQNDSLQGKYKYDGENRLVEVQLNPQNRVTYKYDPFGDKVEKQDTATTITKLIYDGYNLLSELNVGNNSQASYTSALNLDNWLSINYSGSNYYYHKDGLNSIVELTGTAGNISNEYLYDVYGNVTFQNTAINNQILFTGKFLETNIKMYDYGARFYNNEIGRFLSKDKYQGVGNSPLTINKYNYVSNNPVNFIDPTGNFLVPALGIIGGAIIGGTVGGIIGIGSEFGSTSDHTDRNYYNENPIGTPNDASENGWSKEPRWKNMFHQENPYNPFTWDRDKYVKINDDGSSSEAIWDPNRNNGKGGWLNCGEKGGPSYNYYHPQGLMSASSIGHITYDMVPHFKNPNYNCPPEPPPGPNEPPYGPPAPSFPINIPILRPSDPNEIIGTAGFDTTKKWVSVKANLPYKILFENDPDFATASAQKVALYLPIHQKLNPASLRIGDFGFGNFNFTVPENTSVYTNRLDLRDSLGLYIDVTAGLDMTNRRAFWIFESINPATGDATNLPPNSGFLPINDSITHKGEGYVTLTLQPASNAQTGDTATAQATIIFDTEEPIATNTWKNTIDAVAPASSMEMSSGFVSQDFPIKWIGKDDSLGSGVKHYDIYYAKNNGPFALLKDQLTGTGMQFTGGTKGTTYSFYSIATDNTGNKEAQKNNAEASSTILAPDNCAGSSIAFASSASGAGYTYQWQVDNGTGFVNIANNGIYSGSTTNTLLLINAPTSWSGYKYRLIAYQDGNAIEGAIQILRFTNTWLGTTSTAWENPTNWSCNAIPDEYTDVTINANDTYQLRLNSNGVCRSLTLTTGAVFTVSSGYNLNIKGK